jgi:hypothetical protein
MRPPAMGARSSHRGSIRHGRVPWISFHNQTKISPVGIRYDVTGIELVSPIFFIVLEGIKRAITALGSFLFQLA